MKIQYLGHACFKLTTSNASLVIDPYKDGSVDGLAPLRDEASQVIVSHQHADHNGTECVRIVPGDSKVFSIEQLPSWHDDQQGKVRGPNTIHIIECEGLRIAHLGDLGCELSDQQKDCLRNLDVLMIPVGGFFTIDADQAARIAEELAPRCIIPMHFRGDGFGYDVLGTVDLFTKHFNDVQKGSNVLDLDSALPMVAVMDFRH